MPAACLAPSYSSVELSSGLIVRASQVVSLHPPPPLLVTDALLLVVEGAFSMHGGELDLYAATLGAQILCMSEVYVPGVSK